MLHRYNSRVVDVSIISAKDNRRFLTVLLCSFGNSCQDIYASLFADIPQTIDKTHSAPLQAQV